jgi:hypothetical protein
MTAAAPRSLDGLAALLPSAMDELVNGVVSSVHVWVRAARGDPGAAGGAL